MKYYFFSLGTNLEDNSAPRLVIGAIQVAAICRHTVKVPGSVVRERTDGAIAVSSVKRVDGGFVPLAICVREFEDCAAPGTTTRRKIAPIGCGAIDAAVGVIE